MTASHVVVGVLCGLGAIALGCWWMVTKAFKVAVRLGLVLVGSLAVVFMVISGATHAPPSPQAPSHHASQHEGVPQR